MICYDRLWFVWPAVKHPALGTIVFPQQTHIHTHRDSDRIAYFPALGKARGEL